jgi:6-hydroxy-3-succinoylpyridine 3-monooxygenase
MSSPSDANPSPSASVASAETHVKRPRSIVYIDGFNLYYGAVRGVPYKWLNLQRLCEMLRQQDDIQQIYYFTAIVFGPTRSNQETYLRALATLPLVTVILGKFKRKQIKCTLHTCTAAGDRLFQSQEEKRTDVNIAIRMLDDAYQDRCDQFVVISGDSDLVPAFNMVKAMCPKKQIIVYVPARDRVRGAATEIRSAADRDRTLPSNLLKVSQFPASIPDGQGGFVIKPTGW